MKILGPKSKTHRGTIINTTSGSDSFGRELSPFLLGPVQIPNSCLISYNMENAWQFSKVYKCHLDQNNNPSTEWYRWAIKGYSDRKAHRYPMGKGAKPEYARWDKEHLGYIEARNKIYVPEYTKLVVKTSAFQTLNNLHKSGVKFALWDVDGYDYEALGMSLIDVLNCKDKIMGHAFVIAMLLEGVIDEKGSIQ